eukprot:g8526.t1
MRFSQPKKGGDPRDIISDRAGGLDLARTAEMTKWRYMIKHDAQIDLENMRSHIRRFKKAGILSSRDLLVKDNLIDKNVTNEAIIAGGPNAKVFPKLGLGQRIPKEFKALTPEEHEKMLTNVKEVKVIKGESLSQKHLKARMLKMEKTLKSIRQARKSAESDLHQLQRSLNLPLSPLVQISAPPSRSTLQRTDMKDDGKNNNNTKNNPKNKMAKSFSAPDIKSRASTPKQQRKKQKKDKIVKRRVWNKKTQVWEIKPIRMAYGLPDTRESFRSQNIANLFIAGDHRGMTSTNQIGLIAASDLLRKGLVDPKMYMKLSEFDKRKRCPKVMSPVTKFAEHAVRNRLKPFALGRG